MTHENATVSSSSEAILSILKEAGPGTSLSCEIETVLIVDDDPDIVENLRDRLESLTYRVLTAGNGADALDVLRSETPAMLLLDIGLPDMSGIEILKQIRRDERCRDVPVILLTVRDTPHDKVQGLNAGADDYVVKPFDPAELLARMRSKIRTKRKHDSLEEWNRTLSRKLAEQFEEANRMSRFKRYLAPQVAEKLLGSEDASFLKSHRREITVVFLDLRGYTAFSDRVEPEEVMEVLRSYHREMGKIILDFEGTLEHFAGDGIMVFFNDPIPCKDHTETAVRMALAMMAKVRELRTEWRARHYGLDLGIGIAAGCAALGDIGFEGRKEYGAVGNVINLAARLCGKAKGGQILTDPRTIAKVDHLVEAKPVKEMRLKGISCPLTPASILNLKAVNRSPVTWSSRNAPLAGC